MASTNAERQAAYRQRHLKDWAGGKERINLVVENTASDRLARLSRHYGVTKSAMLERLLDIADMQVADSLAATPKQLTQYYDGVTE